MKSLREMTPSLFSKKDAQDKAYQLMQDTDDPWTYKATAYGPHYIINAYDEDGIYAGTF